MPLLAQNSILLYLQNHHHSILELQKDSLVALSEKLVIQEVNSVPINPRRYMALGTRISLSPIVRVQTVIFR